MALGNGLNYMADQAMTSKIFISYYNYTQYIKFVPFNLIKFQLL